jgi:hypothetical protein
MEYQIIGFGIEYANELIYCEAVMRDHYYDILFNSKWRASLEMTDIDTWTQVSGVTLPQTVIDEIGRKIQNHYDEP